MIKPLRFFKLILILGLKPISNKRLNFLDTVLIRFQRRESLFLERGKTFVLGCHRFIVILMIISFFVDNSEMGWSPGLFVKSRPLHFIHFIYYKLKFIITSQSTLLFEDTPSTKVLSFWFILFWQLLDY